MSVVGNLFSSDRGSGFQAGSVPIQAPVNDQQALEALTKVNQGLDYQKAFLQALQGQNGIQNQSNVYNQLQAIASGQGPNPAQAMLNQATGQNIAAQAALMAGQRGTNANAGLLARQAAQQGGNIQQNAVGQAATMQANQALNAINSAGNIAGQQVANLGGATNSYSNAAQNEQQNLLNSIAQQNNARIGMQSNINSNNAAIANTNAQAQNKMVGQGIGAIGAVSGLPFAHGGAVPKMADGGVVSGPSSQVGQILRNNLPSNMNASAPMVAPGAAMTGDSYLNGVFEGKGAKPGAPDASQVLAGGPGDNMGSAVKDLLPAAMMVANKGGKVPAMLSPGEKYLSPRKAQEVAKGKADPIKEGKTIPGKAKVKGDSLKNDIVPAKLEAGGVVIPRSVLQSKDPGKEAAKFVMAVMSKSNLKKGK